MHAFHNRTIRTAVLALAAGVAAPLAAQDGPVAPTYMRTRIATGGWTDAAGYAGRGYGGGYGYFPQVYQPPVVAGSWYQRPYPYHFDYYRYRWNGGNGAAPAPTAECPCADGSAISE